VKSKVAKGRKISVKFQWRSTRKILSNYGGLEAISAIRNIEIYVKSKVAKR
jgi:hypothetical protein